MREINREVKPIEEFDDAEDSEAIEENSKKPSTVDGVCSERAYLKLPNFECEMASINHDANVLINQIIGTYEYIKKNNKIKPKKVNYV